MCVNLEVSTHADTHSTVCACPAPWALACLYINRRSGVRLVFTSLAEREWGDADAQAGSLLVSGLSYKPCFIPVLSFSGGGRPQKLVHLGMCKRSGFGGHRFSAQLRVYPGVGDLTSSSLAAFCTCLREASHGLCLDFLALS